MKKIMMLVNVSGLSNHRFRAAGAECLRTCERSEAREEAFEAAAEKRQRRPASLTANSTVHKSRGRPLRAFVEVKKKEE